MIFLKKLKAILEANRAATEKSRKRLEDAVRTDPQIEMEHQEALSKLYLATEQARKLGVTDRQNHYSESLTHAFRGRAT